MISHRMEGGVEKPIAFASRTLALAEKNYSQLEKEALAIVFAVKKFERTKVMYRCPQPFATTIHDQTRQNGYQTVPFSVYIHNLMFVFIFDQVF